MPDRIDDLKAQIADLQSAERIFVADMKRIRADLGRLREACVPFVTQFDEFSKEQSFTDNSVLSRPIIDFSLLSFAYHKKGG